MNPIPIFVLVVFSGVVGVLLGIIVGAGLTVIGMTRESNHSKSGMWHMNLLETGKTVQEFFNCPSIGLKFPDLDKNIPRAYEVRISRIYEGKTGVSKYVRDKSTKTDVIMEWHE